LTYDDKNQPVAMTYGNNNRKAAYEYDGIGRINKRTVTAGGQAIETSYKFQEGRIYRIAMTM